MSGAIKVDKPCKGCGVLMVDVFPNRTYCNICSKERDRQSNREAKARYKQAHRRGNAIPIINENANYCRGCVYWGGHDASACCCNYLFMMDKRRPCPPGKGCTVRKERRRKEPE